MKECPICDFEAKSENGLATHLRRSHGEGKDQSVREKWQDVRQAIRGFGVSGADLDALFDVTELVNDKFPEGKEE